METLVKKGENLRKNSEESESFRSCGGGNESLTDSSAISRESSSSRSSSEISSKGLKNKSCSSPLQLGWPIGKAHLRRTSVPEKREGEKLTILKDSKTNKLDSEVSELDMMKERFSKLLLGEDMSGSGKGVYSALAISNAITNLSATIFGQVWRLEPLSDEKKSMWRREMDWLLCVSDHIVELIPSWQTFPDGTKLEVMTCRPRSDLFVNLPALCKLDNMLIELLDAFTDSEFWYVDQGIISSEGDGSASFHMTIQRQEEKWWLPVPRVPPGGLSENSRKHLNHRRECVGQILKATMAINSISLAEMEVPQSYLEELPKNGRSCLGDTIYRYITSDQFSPDRLLDCLDLSSEHVALEIANRVEAAIHVWRRRSHSKPQTNPRRAVSKSSWEVVKDLVIDGDKRALLAERAESLLLCLKQRFPALTQSALDTSKIQSNKDVGKSILESYSRVLESLASNIIARIEDLLYVDDLTARSGRLSAISTVNVVAHKKKISYPFSGAVSSSPFKSSSAMTSFSPMPLVSPAMGERTPFIANKNNCKPDRRGFGVKRALTNYLGVETKPPKICGNLVEGSDHVEVNGNVKEVMERQKNSSAVQSGSKLPQNS